MATYRILHWYDIPIGVKARDADGDKIEHLPERFQIAADAVAVNTGLTDTQSYLTGWHYSDPDERTVAAGEVVAKAVAAELVDAYPPKRVDALRHELEARLATSELE